MQLRRAVDTGILTTAGPGGAAVRLLFDDGSAYSHSGRLLFSEATVDATTGQVTLRGQFPNPESVLLPGMYVRVLIDHATRPNAIPVPQQAVHRDNAGPAPSALVRHDTLLELRPGASGQHAGRRPEH